MKSGEWTEVRRRKKVQVQRRVENNDLSNYFVTGFPNGTRKEELRIPLSKFGLVVDVYFGGRKDYQGNNFAFVRYKDVVDMKALEEKLQGIKCRDVTLSVNISKHQRKAPQKPTHATTNSDRRHPTGPAATRYDGIRDNRSYAQATAGHTVKQPNQQIRPATPLVILNTHTHMNNWLSKSTLIAEAHSFDHIGNLPASILMSDDTKYLRGLRMAMHYGNSVAAQEFLDDETRWREWFKWVERADKHEVRYERTAWLKILGLPLKLWDEVNFNLIAERFGRVVSPFDCIRNRRDYSMGKVGVLTSEKRWINQQITIIAAGVNYQIGVVEYTNNWSPFKPAPFDQVEEE
ncbi:unnamed protein product [Lactuca virosa]|uniref:RRM domain-containing protein n=1 Tax=Lactuca virosa TaxID=75947 RepID=A0AAU9P145_9ASTR|nr:unnamed protein product [Lactuca virosa]